MSTTNSKKTYSLEEIKNMGYPLAYMGYYNNKPIVVIKEESDAIVHSPWPVISGSVCEMTPKKYFYNGYSDKIKTLEDCM